MIEVTRDGGLVHVQLYRPDRHNALHPEDWQGLRKAGEELTADPSVQVVIVHGGGTSFCSGIDRVVLAEGGMTPFSMTGDEADRHRTTYEERDIIASQATCRWMAEGDFVTIAAVRGFALGAGAQIAMACDMRIVGRDTTFALPEITIGLIPELSAVAKLPQMIGYDRAMELALTGRSVHADEAERIGLATKVVEPDFVLEEAEAIAAKILRARPAAIAACKRAMRTDGFDASLRLAREGALDLLSGLMTEWDA